MKVLKDNISCALGNNKPELVLKNPFIVNVFVQNIEKKDIAINNGVIVGIGKYSGETEIDCTGKYVCPGFIDGHVHIESSMVVPEIFSQIVLRKGVTTVVADPHEIANVLGLEGIEKMMESRSDNGADVFYMMPSCVPATPFEDNGAELNAQELEKLIYKREVIGLGEVMDVQSVLKGSDGVLEKLKLFKEKVIDGHCPQISQRMLNAYITSGVMTDHECSDYIEALDKVKRGMHVLMREGSAAKNLKQLIKAVNKYNYHMFSFCTDDRHILDIVQEGSIDNCLRIAVKDGLEPVKAITLASYNTSKIYRLYDRGAVAPGYKADLVILKDLHDFEIESVIKNGIVVEGDIKTVGSNKFTNNTVNMEKVNEEIFRIEREGHKVNLIKVLSNSIETKKESKTVTGDSKFVSLADISCKHLNKVAVFERHKNSGKHSVGFIRGFELENCAVAQTICHDSHNVIVIGDNDKDMAVAVNKLIEIGGGIALSSEGKITEFLKLPFGGLMSFDYNDVLSNLEYLERTIKEKSHNKKINHLLTLGFMALVVVPELKITPRGLFDFNKNSFINIFED